MAILIQDISREEQHLLENLLKKMQISFKKTESNSTIQVSDAEMTSINRGLEQASRGLSIDSKEVHK